MGEDTKQTTIRLDVPEYLRTRLTLLQQRIMALQNEVSALVEGFVLGQGYSTQNIRMAPDFSYIELTMDEQEGTSSNIE